LTLFPAAAIAGVVIGFNLLGDGLRGWLSPR
jgi:ABC-type dipeptide/oligopeptide/nickel transport system permease subunit